MKSRKYLRRAVTALVSLCIVLTITSMSFSEPLFINEYDTFTASAVIEDSDNKGNLRLRATVRNSANDNVTFSGNFTFQWQFSTGENGDFQNIATGALLILDDATTAGYYRCAVTFTYDNENNDVKATPFSHTFESNSIRITHLPNTRPYTAYISGSFSVAGTNDVQVNLNAVVRNQAGADITNSGDFEFRWERQDKVNGLPVGYFVPITGAYSSTFSGTFNSPSFIRCRVTYIGDDGEPQNSYVFYTAPVNWTPVLSYSVGAQPIYTTSATTTVGRNLILPTDRPPGFPAGPPFGQGQFNTNTTVVASVNASGQLIIALSNHNLQGGGNVQTIGSNFELHRLTDGDTGADLFDGVGVISDLPNGNSTYTFTSASALPGEGLYSFRFRVWRQNPAFDVIITGFVNISATASNGVLTSVDSTPIPSGGLPGEPISVDYPTYPSNSTGSTGSATILFSYPANSINYVANGGTGSMAEDIVKTGSDYTTRTNAFVRLGWGFAGWNTQANGGGTAYTAQEALTVTEHITLFAQWSQDIFTITYNSNGGTGSMAQSLVNISQNYIVRDNTFNPPGNLVFDNWNTSADGTGDSYTADDIIFNVTADITLFAQWKQGVFYIMYEPNGGSGFMEDSTVNAGDNYNIKANAFDPPTDYRFDGWSFNPEGSGVRYPAGATISTVTEDIILYAQWVEVPEFDFTDSTGAIHMNFILLPADTDEGGILNSKNLRVYFKISQFTDLDDIEFVYGAGELNATLDGIHPTEDPDIYYFYLSNGILQALENGADQVKIRGIIENGEEKDINVRKVGLFNLH